MNRAGEDPIGKMNVKQESTGGRQRFWERKHGAPTPATKYMKGVSFEFGDAWLLELEQQDEGNDRSPEQQLAMAMIADAMRDFKLYWHERNPNGQVLFENANAYLFVWRDLDWPFSFDNLCQHLNMNADEIRRRLRLWLANQRLAAIKNKDRHRGISASTSSADVGLESSRDAA